MGVSRRVQVLLTRRSLSDHEYQHRWRQKRDGIGRRRNEIEKIADMQLPDIPEQGCLTLGDFSLLMPLKWRSRVRAASRLSSTLSTTTGALGSSAALSAHHLSRRRNSLLDSLVILSRLVRPRAARAPCSTHALRVQGRRQHDDRSLQAQRAPPVCSRCAPVGLPPVHGGSRRRGPPLPDSSCPSRLAQRET